VCDSPKDIVELIPKEVLLRVYEDALSEGAREFGKLGKDAVKTARLLLAPLQIGAALQDRLAPMIDRIRKKVPEERRVQPSPELVGPALEKMRYLDAESELWKMYEEILTNSVDRESAAKIHPSFTHLISQLSRDEAWILYRLRERPFNVVDLLDWNKDEKRFENRVILESELPVEELFLPDQIDLYYSHLESLSLVTWPVVEEEAVLDDKGVQVGTRRRSKMKLTDFGKLFVSACVPKEGFQRETVVQ